MNRSRLLAVLALFAVGAGAGTVALRQRAAAHAAEADFAALEKRQAAATAQIAALEGGWPEQAKRAAAVEADNAKLRDALVRAQAAQTEAAKKKSAPLTRPALEERFRTARALAQGGDPAEALRELLWCWDEGLKQVAPAVVPAQRSGLTEALRQLAERYPPARAELEQRRDTTRAKILASTGGGDFLPEYTAWLRALHEEPAVLGLFDEIKPGDPRRRPVAIYASEQLIEARRYAEAMEGKMVSAMFSSLETKIRLPAMKTARDGGPGYLATSTARDIEVLAGSGNVAQARELADRLFAADNSEATRALVQQRAARAGKPDLLK